MNFEKEAKELKENGFSVIKDFLSVTEIQSLKDECSKLLEASDLSENRTIFTSGDKQTGNDYFLNSGDKIRYFFEEKAVSNSGEIVVEDKKALNKIGHALHWWNNTFKQVTFSEKVKEVARALGLVNPVVAQSMYIFKHPKIGGEVLPHQDATYLYTEPNQLVGFWFALEDTNLNNGCLWFIPQSHKGKLTKRMMRNPSNVNQLVIENFEKETFSDEDFVPVQVKKGSLVLIDGKVIHRSGLNQSEKSREVYTFHVVDLHKAKYSKKNWLQPTDVLPFPSLFNTIL